jgi:hypothetical protein
MLAISSPAVSTTVTTGTVDVAGSTDPSTNAASVQYRLENGEGGGIYQTATGVTSWSGAATGVTSGTNLLRAQSLDGSGNVIAEATRIFNYIDNGTLSVTVSGSGSVTAGYSGVTSQLVGKNITLKATSVAPFIFAGWTGSIVSGSASITFPMQNSVNLQANFVPNPFGPVTGAYAGLLTTGSGAQGGLVQLTVTASGIFTGRVQLQGVAFAFAGRLDANGAATVTIPRAGKAPWTLGVQASFATGSDTITGTLSDGTDNYGFTVSQSTFNVVKNIAPQAGRYTLVLGPDPAITGTCTPQGCGYATVYVAGNGAATLVGRMADGSPYFASGRVGNDGTLAIYCVPSGAPAGSSLNGLLTFTTSDVSDVQGTLAWTKGPRATDVCYPAGFAAQLPAVGSRFVRPVAGLQAMDVSPGVASADFGDGDMAQPISVPVLVSPASTVTMVTRGLPDVYLGINPVTGLVLGSFVPPGGKVARAVSGVVLQKQKSAYGYFRGADQCGYFSLSPSS